MQVHALVVDDSGIMRKLVMRAVLEAKLAEVVIFHEAADGVEGLRQFEANPIDIVLADWNMPNLCGLDMVLRIRQAQTKHTPVVMITTEGTLERVEQALNEASVDAYIIKPFTADTVRKKLEPVFEKIAAQRKPAGFFARLSASLQ